MRPIVKLISSCFILLFFVFTSGQDVQFKKSKLKIAEKTITVELAESEPQQMRGLMFRRTLKDEEGMLFIYPDEEIRSFWMKNTFIPLSIGFFDAKGKLIDIQDMEPVKSTIQVQLPSYFSKGNAKYALEVNRGWFSKYKIKLGDSLTLLSDK